MAAASLRNLVGCALFAAPLVGLAAPVVIPHSGVLLGPDDLPVTSPSVQVRFSVHATQTGGNPLWTSTVCPVTVQQGRFATSIGDACSGTPTLDETMVPPGTTRWLEVSVGGVTLLPRLPVSSVPSAQVALRSLDAEALGNRLSSAGTVNTASNPVDWTQIKNVPADVVAGGNYSAGSGLQLDGRQFSIATGGIVDAMLAGAISGSRLAAGTVGTAQLADGSITTAKLALGSVTADRLSGQIPGSLIADGSISPAKLSGGGLLRAGTVTDDCTASIVGAIRWNGIKFQGCDGVRWTSLGGAPLVSNVTPAKVPTAGGTTITIEGSNFTNASQVRVGTDLATNVTLVSSTRITAVSPVTAQMGTVAVSVIAPDGETAVYGGAFTVSPSGDTSATPATTCKTLRQEFTQFGSGVYWIKPTGAASAFQAYCNMTTEGGGWTLLFNLRSDSGTTHYWNDSTFWTTASTEGSASAALTGAYKGAAFDQLGAFSEMMVWVHTNGSQVGYGVYDVLSSYRSQSLRSLLNSQTNTTITDARKAQSGNSGAIINDRRSQNRFGDVFMDVQNAEPIMINQSYANGGPWGGDTVTYNRITTTIGHGNSSYPHTLAGLGGHHERGPGSYVTNYQSAPVLAYCEGSSTYGPSGSANINYGTGTALCEFRGSYLLRDHALFVR